MKEFVNTLAEEFTDKDYAHAYMESHTVSRIAAQIYALRQQRGWSQQDLAEKAGVSQERVCKLECGDFDSLTLKTLWKFSEAFDVHLQVSMEEFRTAVMDVANLDPAKLRKATRLESLNEASCRTLHHAGGQWKLVKDNPFTESVQRIELSQLQSKQNNYANWTQVAVG